MGFNYIYKQMHTWKQDSVTGYKMSGQTTASMVSDPNKLMYK